MENQLAFISSVRGDIRRSLTPVRKLRLRISRVISYFSLDTVRDDRVSGRNSPTMTIYIRLAVASRTRSFCRRPSVSTPNKKNFFSRTESFEVDARTMAGRKVQLVKLAISGYEADRWNKFSRSMKSRVKLSPPVSGILL